MNFDAYPDEEEEFVFIDPSYLDCVLAAGDEGDLPALRVWCAGLPQDSYGRVFVRVDSSAQIEPLPAPPNVGVTWLCQEELGEESRAKAPGQLLVGAVDAWLDEWMRADPLSGRRFRMWTGAIHCPLVRDYWHRVATEAAEISTATEARRLAQ